MKLAKIPAGFSAKKCRLRVVEDAAPYGSITGRAERGRRAGQNPAPTQGLGCGAWGITDPHVDSLLGMTGSRKVFA